MPTFKQVIIWIFNLISIGILAPLSFALEVVFRPLAIIWVVARQTTGTARQVLTLLFVLFIAIWFMYPAFALWAIIQMFINIYIYLFGPRRYELCGQHVAQMLWPRPHAFYDLLIDLFAKMRGAPLSHDIQP